MRSKPSIRTKYRFDPPPKDGSEIVVPKSFPLHVYWDRNLQCWVLSRPLSIETLDDPIMRWRRPR